MLWMEDELVRPGSWADIDLQMGERSEMSKKEAEKKTERERERERKERGMSMKRKCLCLCFVCA